LVGLSKTLAHFDMDPTLVVQVKAFVTPMADAGVVVKEVERWFGSPVAPPLVLVEWESASLPIEIELIAAAGRPKIDEQRPVVDYMATPELAHTAVFSRVARINGPQLVYIGGLYGAATPSDSDGEVRSLFAQLNDVLNQTGSDRRHLVKATYYTVGDGVVGALGKVRAELYDPKRPPAASRATVVGVGLPKRNIAIDMIAVPSPAPAPQP
ncbi:MAG: Rid family hydrolase, partial [Planctomycetia bacterium]